MIDILAVSVELFLLIVLLMLIWHCRTLRRRSVADNYRFQQEVESLEMQNIRLEDAGLKLYELKNALELEQAKTDKLLHNILPEQVIRDLREKGTSLPERFENVSIFFSDIVSFTEIAPTLDPKELILELSDIFGEFDRIFAEHHCQRIKTVGDAYMAVAGLPEADEKHCSNLLRGAMAARDYLIQRNASGHKHKWLMRFGVNSGSVVGGIVGREKYIYDIFGDAVNTASRMEHASQVMKINVSRSTWLLARDEFDFTSRGLIDVKGKGAVEMYFLDGEKKT